MGDGPTHRDKYPIGQDLNIGTIIQLGLGSRASHNYLILPLYPCIQIYSGGPKFYISTIL